MIALLAGVARAGIVLESPPVDGAETVVLVTDADGAPAGGETVRVVLRPGLAGSRELAVGITDGRGRVRWTPDGAGLTRLRAGEEQRPLVVAASQAPAITVGLLGALGALALGLLVVGSRERR